MNLYALFRNDVEALKKHVKFMSRINPERIHEFRLCIKRLRCYAELYRHTTGDKATEKRFVGMLKPVFKLAGFVRTIHVNLEILKNAGYKIRSYEMHQKNLLETHIRELLNVITELDKKRFVLLHEEALQKMQKLSKSDIRKTTRRNQERYHKRIERLLSEKKTHQLHDARKFIKKVQYVNSLTDSKESVINKDALKFYTELDKKIGYWNDLQILAESLQNYSQIRPKNRLIAESIKAIDTSIAHQWHSIVYTTL